MSRRNFGCTASALSFRAEQEDVAGPAVVERLLAHPVSREIEGALLPVPNGEREHPVCPTQRLLDAQRRHRLDQHLGVRVAAPRPLTEGLLQRAAHLLEIVDFAVVGDHPAAIGGAHRLRAGLGEVDDRQASMAKRQAALRFHIGALAVRPAVGDRLRHGPDKRLAGFRREAGTFVEETDDAAHVLNSPPQPSA